MLQASPTPTSTFAPASVSATASASASATTSPSPSPAASFFARLNGPPAAQQPHPRSFSLSAADGPSMSGQVGASLDVGAGSATGAGTSSSAAGTTEATAAPSAPHAPPHGVDLRRAVSMRASTAHSRGFGMSSFSAAGSDLVSPTSSIASGYTPPAAARHPLFSHHALPPGGVGGAARPFSPAYSVTSDPGVDPGAPPEPDMMLFPPSPTGSTLSSPGTGTFSPASAFLSSFGRSRRMSIAGLPEEPLLPDAQGAKVLEYTLGKIIGRGGFSTVRQATHSKTGEVLACKIVKRDDLSDQSGSLEGFEDEIRIWQALPEHPALLPLIEMHRTPYATFLFMPLLAGGSLLEVLRHEGGSDKTARKWFPGVVSAVAALQEGYETFGGNMLHGDLKLDNFMVDTAGGIRLGDFGMAKMLTEAETLSVPGPGFKSGLPPHMGGRQRLSSAPSPNPRSRGRQMSRSPNRRRETFTAAELTPNPASPMPSASLPYAPPELLCAPPAPASLKQDIWALGVILYALLTGRLPFTDSFDPRLQMKILRGQYDPLPPHMGHEWLEVLHGCLERDLHARWDIQRVRTSDAVTGWREVKPKAGSRSRSRVRLAPDSPGIDGIPLAGRGRDRSRSRLRTTPGHAHSHSGSISGSGHGSLAHAPLAAHHRHGSYTDTPSPGLDERDGGFFRSRHGLESRSRSASSTCQRQRPISGAGAGDVHMLGTGTDERLIAALDEVAISRGRRGRRDDDRMDSTGPGTPRDGSASSLHVRDGRQERARSRTRLDGVQVPVPGSGPPSARERHHWSHVQHERTYAHVQPDQQGNIHNPTPMQDHNAGHPHGLVHGHSHNHGHGHQNGVIAEPEDPHTPGRWRAPDAHAQSRPPTLGIVLDAVDEEGRGRRGRGHGHEGGGFGTGYGHDHGPAPGARSRSLRRME